MHKKLFLFTYATLRSQPVIEKETGPLKYERPYILKDYEKTHEDYSTVIPSPGSHVLGMVYEVTPAQLHSLDKWENKYKRYILQENPKEIIYIYIKDKQ